MSKEQPPHPRKRFLGLLYIKISLISLFLEKASDYNNEKIRMIGNVPIYDNTREIYIRLMVWRTSVYNNDRGVSLFLLGKYVFLKLSHLPKNRHRFFRITQ